MGCDLRRGSYDELGRLKLEQQVMTLTREKKQLLTHLHWLSRQQNDVLCPAKYTEDPEDAFSKVSLEEGNVNTCDAVLVTTKVRCRVGRSVSEEKATRATGKARHSNSTTQQLIDRLRGLKMGLLQVSRRVTKNNDLCDVIFQLSFQNLRHPYEPRSYSNWPSYEENKSLSVTSLEKCRDGFDVVAEPRMGFCSLESFQATEMNKTISASSSSPEIFLRDATVEGITKQLLCKSISAGSRSMLERRRSDHCGTSAKEMLRNTSITDNGQPVTQPVTPVWQGDQGHQSPFQTLGQEEKKALVYQENLIS